MSKKIRSNSFSARLTAAQRDELFEALAGGLAFREAGGKIRDWIKANDEAGLNGEGPHPELALADHSVVCRWYQGVRTERRYETAREIATVVEQQDLGSLAEQGQRALAHARWLAALEGLKVTEIVALERSQLARERIELEREKLADRQRRQASLAAFLMERQAGMQGRTQVRSEL